MMEDQQEVFEEKVFVLESDNSPSIRFKGRLLAEVSSSSNNASGRYSGETGRWATFKIYVTSGGKYVCQRVHFSQWQNEGATYTTMVFMKTAEVLEFFGYDWLAKEIYDQAGIECVIDVD